METAYGYEVKVGNSSRQEVTAVELVLTQACCPLAATALWTALCNDEGRKTLSL